MAAGRQVFEPDMVDTIVFHAEADAATAAQIATMLSARRKPLTYCVTNDNAAASAQLRMGPHMIALGLIGPHSDLNAMRRVLAPVLNGRRRALLLLPGANPPDDVMVAAPSVALHGEHAADSALVDNIDRYASALPQPDRGARARTRVLEFPKGSPPRMGSPLYDLPQRPSAEVDDAAPGEPERPMRIPLVTVLLCAAAVTSIGFFAWRTYSAQTERAPERPTLATPFPEPSNSLLDAAGEDEQASTTPADRAPPNQTAAPAASTAPATDAAAAAPSVSSSEPPPARSDEAPVEDAIDIRGREAQGPDR